MAKNYTLPLRSILSFIQVNGINNLKFEVRNISLISDIGGKISILERSRVEDNLKTDDGSFGGRRCWTASFLKPIRSSEHKPFSMNIQSTLSNSSSCDSNFC